MKKIVCLVMTIAMTLMFASCSDDTNDTTTTTTATTSTSTSSSSTVTPCSQEELVEKTGINLEAPNGADKIEYAYCEGDVSYAETKFTFNGATYVYRAQFTNATDIKTCTDGTVVDVYDVEDTMEDGTNIGVALGADDMDLFLDDCEMTKVSNREAIYIENMDDAGLVTWLDVAPGVLYTMTMDKDADDDELIEMAEVCFAPM